MAKLIPQREGDERAGSFLWSPEEAERAQVNQIGVSACGATAVLNVLSALAWKPMPRPEEADVAVATRLRKEKAPLPEYLLSRSVAGATHEDIMKAVAGLTQHAVTSHFFHMFPEVPEDLFLWLKEWIDHGGVPVATLNLQRGVAEGDPIPDAWHHQMIYGVSSEGVHLTNPFEVVPFSRLRQQLRSESELLIRAGDIITRWRPNSDYTLLKGGRWGEMKVEEKVEQMVMDVLAHRPCASHVVIPAIYKSGITIFGRVESSAGNKLTGLH